MNNGRILCGILSALEKGQKLYWILLDPDDFSPAEASEIAHEAETCGAHGLLIGGSLLKSSHFDSFVLAVKSTVSLPVILFPGDATQISAHADAILFHSLISGRNPVNLIGEQVKGAPLIKEFGIEPIPTAYMLVESGAVTSVEFMSNTRPLPRAKPMIAAAHALAAQYLGMRMVYLEAGSGALNSVPADMIAAVKQTVDIPVITGGGIRDAATATEKLKAGSDIIVTGNILKYQNGRTIMKSIADAIVNFRPK